MNTTSIEELINKYAQLTNQIIVTVDSCAHLFSTRHEASKFLSQLAPEIDWYVHMPAQMIDPSERPTLSQLAKEMALYKYLDEWPVSYTLEQVIDAIENNTREGVIVKSDNHDPYVGLVRNIQKAVDANIMTYRLILSNYYFNDLGTIGQFKEMK